MAISINEDIKIGGLVITTKEGKAIKIGDAIIYFKKVSGKTLKVKIVAPTSVKINRDFDEVETMYLSNAKEKEKEVVM